MRLLLLSLLLAVSAGCGKRLDVIIRHPLEVGTVDQPNTIVHGSWQGTLTRLDPEWACADISIEIETENAVPDASLQAQELLFQSDSEWYSDAQVIEARPGQVSSYQGTRTERYQAGTVNECTSRASNGNCLRWENRPRYESRLVPTTFYRATGSGVVCFPNQGRVSLATERVVFAVNRVYFRWGLESVVAPQTPATSGGEAVVEPAATPAAAPATTPATTPAATPAAPSPFGEPVS